MEAKKINEAWEKAYPLAINTDMPVYEENLAWVRTTDDKCARLEQLSLLPWIDDEDIPTKCRSDIANPTDFMIVSETPFIFTWHPLHTWMFVELKCGTNMVGPYIVQLEARNFDPQEWVVFDMSRSIVIDITSPSGYTYQIITFDQVNIVFEGQNFYIPEGVCEQ